MRRLARALPAVAWAGLTYWLSSQPRLPETAFLFPGADKVFHALAYGVLALLIAYALEARRARASAIAVLVATVYGATDEAHQALVPGRSPDVLDLVADAVGATLFVGARWLWRARAPARIEET